ncbi:GntR family transcriptional regulator [Vulcanimicrobium alpinum]|uniref:GntR family transcriptional regulator n=1 Tax=Vulcanimicrobium alpinum TaxID=3016050 RepID=A0AAN2C8U4_UNVUL|nr:FCD domain-containing protein [Vulcanimicrobium alpinum]BDE05850.1 GntR family transcriptional regulator [Vulcanimicrobium alpinum]
MSQVPQVDKHSGIGAIRSEKLYVLIAREIVRLIEEGRCRIGERLPPERVLIERFGVSRAPVREALSALELMGVVEARRGGGVFVTFTSPKVAPVFSAVSPEEIIEVRIALEPLAAGLAAKRAAKPEIDAIVSAADALIADAARDAYSPHADERFHTGIARASHNAIAARTLEDVHAAMRQPLWGLIRDRTVVAPEPRARNAEDHRAIADAIRRSDPHEAEQLMLRHLRWFEKTYWSAAPSIHAEHETRNS